MSMLEKLPVTIDSIKNLRLRWLAAQLAIIGLTTLKWMLFIPAWLERKMTGNLLREKP
jgi:hypothetical protein